MTMLGGGQYMVLKLRKIEVFVNIVRLRDHYRVLHFVSGQLGVLVQYIVSPPAII